MGIKITIQKKTLFLLLYGMTSDINKTILAATEELEAEGSESASNVEAYDDGFECG